MRTSKAKISFYGAVIVLSFPPSSFLSLFFSSTAQSDTQFSKPVHSIRDSHFNPTASSQPGCGLKGILSTSSAVNLLPPRPPPFRPIPPVLPSAYPASAAILLASSSCKATLCALSSIDFCSAGMAFTAPQVVLVVHSVALQLCHGAFARQCVHCHCERAR